jgi:nucleoid DNA-binding protein
MATTKMGDEFISVDEVTVSPRGRKKVIDQSLADLLGKLKEGQAVRLAGKFGNVPAEKRPAVSQVIRKHWGHVRTDACRIDYTPEGVPQVRVKA